ncbi:ABC transporter substrate-binding protein [Metabacillus endolithicus]|uniref:ABC transporter substrate-binding protein n=1 Tax=Metabacillus endolithicus TaxID=1535204 RepID=A0ABW5BT27_9BACI|nr:ABC transporter substrate-binding protein [Metabacillus endolithicus]UPG62898.1 ABC transporter substrate-binding protein [Metabacillus endolithicus]
MNLIEHYVNLRLAYQKYKEEEKIETTTGEISLHLSCTMRNTNILMKKMMELGYLKWMPQKGRGRKSTLLFHLSLLEAATNNVQRLLAEKNFEEAYSYILSIQFSQVIKEKLLHNMHSHFGLKSITHSTGRRDTLKIPQNMKIHTLDPTFVGIVHEAHLVQHIFDTLVRYDRGSKSYIPGIALAWEENNGTEWTFYLRKGVMFHHGRVLQAKDVQYTMERLRTNQKIPYHTLFECVEKVTMIDDITIQFTLNKPNYMFLDVMSSFFSSIIPHDIELDPLKPIGTGPYQVEKNEEHLLVLEAFPHHFQGRPFLDTIEVWHMPNLKEQPDKIEEEVYSVEHDTATYQELGSFFFVFNLNKNGCHHHNKNFRLAIQQIIDPFKLVNELGYPRKYPAYSFRLEQSKQIVNHLQNNLEEAKRLLSLSGYEGQILKVATFDFKEAREDMEWLKMHCQQIGLNIEVSVIQASEIYEKKVLGLYDIIYTGETFEINEELSLYMMYSSDNSVLRMALDSKTKQHIDIELNYLISLDDLNKRSDGFHNIEDWLREEAYIIQTYHTIEEQNYHKALNGIEVSGYGMPDLRSLWVKPDIESSSSYSIYIP